MKKLILLMTLLTACSQPMLEENSKSCDIGNGDTEQVWDDRSYTLPECWEIKESTDTKLVLKGPGLVEDSFMLEVSETPLDYETGRNVLMNGPKGEALYVYLSDAANEDASIILDTLLESPFVIDGGSCETPDGTYAQSINHKWKGLEFALPFCWGASEVGVMGAEPALELTKNADDEELWVLITEKDPTVYGENVGELYSFQADGMLWYIQTNDAQNSEVQLIINSLIVP